MYRGHITANFFIMIIFQSVCWPAILVDRTYSQFIDPLNVLLCFIYFVLLGTSEINSNFLGDICLDTNFVRIIDAFDYCNNTCMCVHRYWACEYLRFAAVVLPSTGSKRYVVC